MLDIAPFSGAVVSHNRKRTNGQRPQVLMPQTRYNGLAVRIELNSVDDLRLQSRWNRRRLTHQRDCDPAVGGHEGVVRK
jgi:hypothetical protein